MFGPGYKERHQGSISFSSSFGSTSSILAAFSDNLSSRGSKMNCRSSSLNQFQFSSTEKGGSTSSWQVPYSDRTNFIMWLPMNKSMCLRVFSELIGLGPMTWYRYRSIWGLYVLLCPALCHSGQNPEICIQGPPRDPRWVLYVLR